MVCAAATPAPPTEQLQPTPRPALVGRSAERRSGGLLRVSIPGSACSGRRSEWACGEPGRPVAGRSSLRAGRGVGYTPGNEWVANTRLCKPSIVTRVLVAFNDRRRVLHSAVVDSEPWFSSLEALDRSRSGLREDRSGLCGCYEKGRCRVGSTAHHCGSDPALAALGLELEEPRAEGATGKKYCPQWGTVQKR